MNADAQTPKAPLPLFRPKGYLGVRGLIVVLSILTACVLVSTLRVLAIPGFPLATPDWLLQAGAALDQGFTLAWVPASDRGAVTYLLMLPTAALVITLARLTLGLRVLGYRSILIAIGFHEIGVLPSMLVMSVVVGIIVLLRPSMRRVRLPLYARVSMILGITACILVAALMIGAWQRSELIWSLAFFPVIILAMMAEAIASTLDQGNFATAAWRLFWTLVIAFLLLALINTPPYLDTLVRFPELMVAQLMGIVLVSEYLDLRLFQDWQSTLGSAMQRVLGRPLDRFRRKPRVAVLRNRWQNGVIARIGVEGPGEARATSIQHLVDALRDQGYLVKVFEGDTSAFRELRSFLPPNPRTGAPGGIVLNLCAGLQGHGRPGHVPAMLEMAGLPYTGPDPVSHGLCADRLALTTLLRNSGVACPETRALEWTGSVPGGIDFPCRVGPRDDFADFAHTVDGPDAFQRAADALVRSHGPALVVELEPRGKAYLVGVVGNTRLECLPLFQPARGDRPARCPANVDASMAERLGDVARRCFRAVRARDYAVVSARVDREGGIVVTDIATQGIFARKGPLEAMARAAGLDRGDVGTWIVRIASQRAGTEWVNEGEAHPTAPAGTADSLDADGDFGLLPERGPAT